MFSIRTISAGIAAIAAPGIAVQWDRAGAYFWKRGDDGMARRASIIILQRTDDRVLVEGDIVPGEIIVTEGADRVRAGVELPAIPLPVVPLNTKQKNVGAAPSQVISQ